jgi:hypothetical protein
MSFASSWSIRSWRGGSDTFSTRDQFGTEHLNTGPSVAEFARNVRRRRWRSALPLLASIAAGAAMLWAAAAPPPSVEAQRAYSVESRSAAMYRDPAADFSYDPTPNWLWPSLSTERSQASIAACDAAVARSSC